MGKETKQHRHDTIRQKIRRHDKVKKLQARYLLADSKTRELILIKLHKINAGLPVATPAK